MGTRCIDIFGHAMNVNALTQEKRAAAAEVIGAFLHALHSLQPGPEVGSLLPREDERIIAEEYFARVQREIAPKLRPLEAGALIKQFEIYLNAPENFLFQPAVLHADLSRDHILIENDSVTAVIDFGDVNWGDPDYDFMYLCRDAPTEPQKYLAALVGLKHWRQWQTLTVG